MRHQLGSSRFQRTNALICGPTRNWHETRLKRGVLVALPNCQGRVSPVFDVAARLLVVRLEAEAELDRKEVVLFEKQPQGIARRLRELGIEVLICAAISQELHMALERVGVRVLARVCGGIDAVLMAYRTRTLGRPEFVMPGCRGWQRAALGGKPRKRCVRSLRRRFCGRH
jgi:predicted Fe-Mo cluster-binding NifX family protein